jgi:Uma2 family endonuclease
MAITQRRLTLEEFLSLPEEKPALEYLGGEVTRKVSPKFRHSRLAYKFAELVNGYAEPLQLALAVPELRTTFGGRSPVPDVAVLRWDRIPYDADGNLLDDVFEPPATAVEIVSPGQSVAGLRRKCARYVANGVEIALLMDPSDKSIVDFRPGAAPRRLGLDERIDLDGVLPGFALTPRELFASLRR